MAQTLFFYDLETSGLSAREDRIMQFAGIRTDMDFNQIGEPFNLLVKLNDDTLPTPDALMVTGITPQQTVEDGYTEAEFAKILMDEVFTPDTTVVGFNNIRFDDEFIRHLFWRNFYDPYEWSWKDGRSRWDLLDVVRMTRVLRPDGIEWPVDDKGEPTNRLELITKVNKISHEKAHDALSDVEALIAVSKLIREKQPQLYNYLFEMRHKKSVQKLVNLDSKQPFCYSSGRFDKEFQKTTVAMPLTAAPNHNVVVYDLRYDPSNFFDLSVEELSGIIFAPWEERQKPDFKKLPAKVLQYNRAPAVAPLGVLEKGKGWERISLDKDSVSKNMNLLLSRPDFAEKIRTVFENREPFEPSNDPEARLYDDFVGDRDRLRIETVREATVEKLADFHPDFQDTRLPKLLLHYKARNFPKSLAESELIEWESWRKDRLEGKLPGFLARLNELSKTATEEQAFILQELGLWAESILPID